MYWLNYKYLSKINRKTNFKSEKLKKVKCKYYFIIYKKRKMLYLKYNFYKTIIKYLDCVSKAFHRSRPLSI